ncbi:MAG: methyltransferase domain-containing protein [Gammaproteobacteria bacterium]|nr:methyltransferase domain-containing protein [Gammaproteobacteria bacterium]MBV9727027.1 methyltransferase domain-containing protein [Gammaproteobacteria bacterium]
MPVRTSGIPDRDSALCAWWDTPIARALLAAESELLSEALEDVFGWELLQVGAWGSGRELLAGSRSRRQSLIAGAAFAGAADILARPSQLPLTSDCIDAVLLPHTLEFAPDPYAILREVDRVLVGEGQLLVLGFRPWSLWGMRARWSRSGFPPGMRRVLSERLLREWLVLLGFEVVAAQRYLYLSPWSRGLARGEGTGRMLRRGLTYPLPAGAFLLKARKRVYTLTPVRARFREKPAVIGGLVKPTTRSQA